MNTILEKSTINFELPKDLSCPLPTEERHMDRDLVRMLVTRETGESTHAVFKELSFFLDKGDVVVVNLSATVPVSLPVSLPGRFLGKLHVSTRLPGKEWLAEIRMIEGQKTKRWQGGAAGMVISLPAGAEVILKELFYKTPDLLHLWKVSFNNISSLTHYLTRHASPIQYERLNRAYPLEYYQTHFAFRPGSAEMPSAARGFTTTVVNSLLGKGIHIVPILLHTGLSSLEENEPPYPEYMEIDPVTASLINHAKSRGNKIIATGTTAIRALETAVNQKGIVEPYSGYTDMFIEPGYTMKAVDGLITGFHEPRASHLFMLQSLAGKEHIQYAYDEALEGKYYWHQFGDLHLILPWQCDATRYTKAS